jgi:electron transfer flavoprotein alpha subunit
MVESQGVLVLGEVSTGRISTSTAETLAAGRHLVGQTGAKLALGLFGNNLGTAAHDALQAGADHIYTVEDPLLDPPQADLYLAAAVSLCQTISPDMILLARTPLGRDVAPRLACRLRTSLLQDCLDVGIDADSGRLMATRPVYGGSILARVRCMTTPQIAALRPKAYAPLAPDPSRQGEMTPVSVTLDASMAKVTVVRQELTDTPGIKLEEARIVVAGGRGLGGPAPFTELQELAGMLDAGIGASRAAVDAGWVPANWQVGLTGKTITPELYITVGISGASQHMAGCSHAKVIVAINKDREANIFREARYGVVGDWQVVLPAFMETVRSLK